MARTRSNPMTTSELIGQPDTLRHIAQQTASELEDEDFDFIAANAPTGMVPGWELRNELDRLRDETVPLVYIREEKKKGGQKETVTGDDTTPLIEEGDTAVVVDAVPSSNFSERIGHGTTVLRDNEYGGKEYEVAGAVSFLPQTKSVERSLEREGLTLTDVSQSVLESDAEPRDPEEPDYERKNEREIAEMLLESGAVEIRDVAQVEDEIRGLSAEELMDLEADQKPFLYSSGFWGPGYAMVKGLVGQPEVMNELLWNVANTVHESDAEYTFVVGNVTGGLIPGWQIRNYLQVLSDGQVPFAYADGVRYDNDKGELLGEGELVGDEANPNIQKQPHRYSHGDKALIIEELVNQAGTTFGSAVYARRSGYDVTDAATIINYETDNAGESLIDGGITIHPVTSIPTVLEVAEEKGIYPERAVEDYGFFLREGAEAYLDRWDIERRTEGGTK